MTSEFFLKGGTPLLAFMPMWLEVMWTRDIWIPQSMKVTFLFFSYFVHLQYIQTGTKEMLSL